ncbi:MAG TPA: family 16 glycoside hydrolase [Nocardioides sp.]|nr:family 16 glycoside hydrolase [Nocardioides sp.]
MQQPAPTRTSPSTSVGTRLRALLLAATGVAVGAAAVVAVPAQAAVGDQQIAWLEVEDGVISGGPALNSGDHGNFSGSGSYTFRETGMTSTMTVVAPEAGTYPVWIRYAAGPLSAEENVTRGMGLLTNGGPRQVVSYPLTGSWEDWDFARADVTLQEGANTIAVECNRASEMCRLNFDAIQVGGLAPDTCAPTPVAPGGTALFDGTFASFDGWRKTGGGGFGHQTDCTIRSFRGPGTSWHTAQQSGPYTLRLDWRRGDSDDDSSVFLASTSRDGAAPTGGYQVRIGATDTATIVPAGGTAQAADPAALAAAVAPPGQWNRFTIQVTPARIRVLLNGTPVNAVDRTAAMTGFIGLENRSDADRVDFRDIQVSPGVELGALAGPVRRAVLADGVTADPGGESTLANLVAEAQRWATRGPLAGNAKIALVSPTVLGADLVADVAYPSPVTYEQAADVLAAEPLVNMRLTGAQLETVLEQQWQRASGGSVPTRAFLRLGASEGFTWTEDPTRAEGDRITGMWLNGAAILPTGTYSVTVTQSLAVGGDNFHGLVAGIGRRTPDATSVSALAAHLADASVDGPVAPPPSQRAVAVSVPGGAPASYVAGTTYAVDLASWSYSTASDPRDTAVTVTVAGRSIGSFAVDDTPTDGAYDDHGDVAVRGVLPADLAAGAAIVRIVGSTTGTTVQLPITVTAAPTPPAPTPTTTPTPTPTPAPPLPTVVAQVEPTLTVKVKPRRVVARETRARVVVLVAATGSTPTGKVTVKVGTRTVRARLRDGRAVLTLPVFTKAGRAKVKVAYAGDARTLSATTTVRVRVRAAG